jgi:molybdopterin/thiamine biosynthesis adenylyltransferase
VTVTSSLQVSDAERFDRLRRISWWNQRRLSCARVLVIGAGALGNEVLKNLALLGVGNVFIVDLDIIEGSNLSRSILFRERDEGLPKAQAAAKATEDIYAGTKTHWFCGDVVNDLGLGVYRWADVVIAGLDNREARLHVNRSCWKVNRPWVDGATEVLQGVVRVFIPPDSACYECTMTAADWQLLNERRGCAGMKAESLPQERVATTPTTASIVAALECQEALKLLHGLPSLSGEGVVFNGIANDFYSVRYNRDEECNSHETFAEVVSLARRSDELTGRELLDEARARLGLGAVIEFGRDILISIECLRCGRFEQVFKPSSSVPESAARCPECGEMRCVERARTADGSEPWIDRTLRDLGLPQFDIIAARKESSQIGFEVSGDVANVLGSLDVFIREKE